jgi:hypothetical protein
LTKLWHFASKNVKSQVCAFLTFLVFDKRVSLPPEDIHKHRSIDMKADVLSILARYPKVNCAAIHFKMPSRRSLQQPQNSQTTQPEKRKKRQKRDRRKKNLIRKAYEFSTLCDADICLGIRIRENGRVFTFCADTSGIWSAFTSNLVFTSAGCSASKVNPDRAHTILSPSTRRRQTLPLLRQKRRNSIKATFLLSTSGLARAMMR